MSSVPEKLLVVVLDEVDHDTLRNALGDSIRPGSTVAVLAPMSKLSRIEWLTNEEDAERRSASDRAGATAEALDDATGSVEIAEVSVGASDPVLAVEDALRQYVADRVVVFRANADETTWLEADLTERLGHLDAEVDEIVAST